MLDEPADSLKLVDQPVIAKLEAQDRAAWAELFEGYNKFYERALESAAFDRACTEFQRDEAMHALGARLDGRLVGIVHFLEHPSTTSADVCYLQDLFTASDVRGRGVGRALIAAVVEHARARGCARVYWMTHETNTTARALYDRVAVNGGFIRYQIEL